MFESFLKLKKKTPAFENDTRTAEEKQMDQIIEDINTSATGIEQDGLSELSDVDLADLSSGDEVVDAVGDIISLQKKAA